MNKLKANDKILIKNYINESTKPQNNLPNIFNPRIKLSNKISLPPIQKMSILLSSQLNDSRYLCFENNSLVHNINSYLTLKELKNITITNKKIYKISLELFDVNKYNIETKYEYNFLMRYKKIKIINLTVSININCDELFSTNIEVDNIVFGYNFNHIINFLPNMLTKIHFGNNFNQTINFLPNTLSKIYFGNNFNKLLINPLPESLIELIFGWQYNQPISRNILSKNLKRIKFGYNFNQLLIPGILPESLLELEFSGIFNQILLPGILPNQLIKLTFGAHFNQNIVKNVLPPSLREIIFGWNYNQSIYNILPPNLEKIKFGWNFKQHVIASDFPPNIKIEFSNDFNKHLINSNLCIIWNTH